MQDPPSQLRFLRPRLLVTFPLCSVGAFMAMLRFAATPSGNTMKVTASSSSVVQLFAGGGVGDGAPPTSAVLSFPMGLSRTTDGRLLIADSGGRIRSVSGSGITSTIGGPAPGFSPFGVAQRSDGTIWFVQRETSA